MKHVALLAVAALCAGAAAWMPFREPRQISGWYRISWEEQSFTPCGGSERWWVADPGPLMARYRQVVTRGDWGTVYATVRAEVSDPGRFGHMGMYPRSIAIREVVAARAPGDSDCRERQVEAR
jgi:hypothetical protein